MAKRELTASDVKALMLRNYRRFSSGEISESKAFRENVMLGNILKAFEAAETQERLQAIESALKNNKLIIYDDEE